MSQVGAVAPIHAICVAPGIDRMQTQPSEAGL